MSTQTQKFELKELVYKFQPLKKGESINLSKKSKIFLMINGKETDIPIENLFLKDCSIDDDDITGYSILQMLTENTKLKIDENTTLDITFVDKASEKQFYVSKIRRPLSYDDEIEITTEKRLEYIDLLLMTVSRNTEPSVITETPEEVAAKEAAAIKAQEEQQKIEEEAKRVEAEEAKRIADEEAAKMVLGGTEWETERQTRISEGLTEYQSGDFRFFHKPAVGNEDAVIGMYFLEPGDFYVVVLYEEEITEEFERYTFEDGEQNEYATLFNKKDNTFTVEEAKINS